MSFQKTFNRKFNFKTKGNFAGGRPATDPFLLCGQKKGAKEKATPVFGYDIT
jgi:hypothetical protein